jgi:hypothetical protein
VADALGADLVVDRLDALTQDLSGLAPGLHA